MTRVAIDRPNAVVLHEDKVPRGTYVGADSSDYVAKVKC
jgi:hypothetical protein